MILSGRGVFLSLFASILFGIIPGYVQWLTPLDGIQVFAQRVLWSIPAVLVLVVLGRQMQVVAQSLERLLSEPRVLLACPLAAALLGVHWALFVWAPLEGYMLDLSLGYFLLPLAMVVVGRVFYGEQLSRLQKIAVFFAVLGVLHELWVQRSFSWVTLVTALGYPPYFMLRRWMRLDALTSFVIELLLLAPVAIWLVMHWGPDDFFTTNPNLWWLLPGLGLLGSIAFASMMSASRLLPLGLFGILSYVEPVLLFAVSLVFLGEKFAANQWLTYLPIWLAVILVGWDSARILIRQYRRFSPT